MNGAQAKPSPLSRAARIAVAILPWLPMLGFPFLLLSLWKVAVSVPFQLDYGEAEVLHSALRLARGESIYPVMGSYPYINTPYPPLYIALCAAALRLTGVSFLPGRLISLAAGGATLILAAAIVWRETRSKAGAALAAALLVSVGFFAYWIMLMRVDALALALSVLGLLLAMRGRHLAAALVFAAALFTRQSAVAAPAAVLAGLLLERRGREAARFALAMGIAVIIPFAALMILTRGWFYAHAFKVLAIQVWFWSGLAREVGQTLHSWPAFAAVGAAVAAWALVRRRARTLALYFIAGSLLSLSAGKLGASMNYFLDFAAAASILIALAYAESLRSWGENARARLAAVALSLAMTCQLAAMGYGFVGVMQRIVLEPTSPLHARAVLERIEQTRGPILCEDYGLLDLAGRRVLLEPFEFARMVRAGLANPEPVLEDVRRRRFALIVMRINPATQGYLGVYRDANAGRWFGPVVDEIRANYTLRERYFIYYLLTPNSPPSP
jgi:hypothetical protein